jgi:hypothetical protein
MGRGGGHRSSGARLGAVRDLQQGVADASEAGGEVGAWPARGSPWWRRRSSGGRGTSMGHSLKSRVQQWRSTACLLWHHGCRGAQRAGEEKGERRVARSRLRPAAGREAAGGGGRRRCGGSGRLTAQSEEKRHGSGGLGERSSGAVVRYLWARPLGLLGARPSSASVPKEGHTAQSRGLGWEARLHTERRRRRG